MEDERTAYIAVYLLYIILLLWPVLWDWLGEWWKRKKRGGGRE